MRIVVLIACILAIVYADEIVTKQIFRNHLSDCQKVLQRKLLTERGRDVGLIFCATKKVGGINKRNALVREKVLANCEAILSDPIKVEKCKDICNKCIDEGSSVPGSNFIKTVRAIQCAISLDLISFMDKD